MEKRTKLDELAEKARLEHIAKNSYKTGNEYNSANLNALSNGDEKGKGENNGQIGSSIDINERIKQTGQNTYKDSRKYGVSDLNALSNGDEKGKGENNGQIGSSIDINERNKQTLINQYGSTKSYPDFVR